jgi:hypothetical protein
MIFAAVVALPRHQARWEQMTRCRRLKVLLRRERGSVTCVARSMLCQPGEALSSRIRTRNAQWCLFLGHLQM